MKKPKISQKLPLYFTRKEFDKLIAIIDDTDINDIVNFAVLTGLRQSDLIALEWNQVIIKQKTLVLDNRKKLTKSKRILNIPLNSKVVSILKRRKRQAEGNLVFTYKGNPIKQLFISHKFKKYVIKSNINPNLNFHSLRHTFASWLVQRGVPIYNVSKLLGHSNIRTTEIYAHLRSEDLRDSVDLL